MLPSLLIWAVSAIACGVVAYKTDRNIKAWSFAGMAVGALALLILLVVAFNDLDFSFPFRVILLVLCAAALVWSVVPLAMQIAGAGQLHL